MRRLIALAVVWSLLCFVGCDDTRSGTELMEQARTLYAASDSAYVSKTNVEGHEPVEVFVYRVDPERNEQMTYYHMQKQGENVYQEYHDGVNLFYANLEDTEWTAVSSGELYKRFTKTQRHPMADKQLLFYEPDSIDSCKVVAFPEGTQVVITYAPDKLTSRINDVIGVSGGITGLTTTLVLTPEGYPKRMHILAYQGTERKASIEYEFRNFNGVPEIERPELLT